MTVLNVTWFEDSPGFVKALEKISQADGAYYGKKVEDPMTAVWVTSADIAQSENIHPSDSSRIEFESLDIQGTLGAPATEFAYATLRAGKTEAELDKIALILEEAGKETKTCRGFSIGKSFSAKAYTIVFVLGWDTVADHWAAVGKGGPLESTVTELFKVADVVLYHSILSKHPTV